MYSEIKTWNRSIINPLVFFNGADPSRKKEYVEMDLSDFRVLHSGVDTFKQLFRGTLNSDLLSIVAGHYETNARWPLVLGDWEFMVSKSASASGFQWILKNLDKGVICLLKSFYAEADVVGTHFKIEYSPHFLLNRDAWEIDQTSVDLASIFMAEFLPSDIAVHIAVDFKGWELPDNLEKNLRTKAKRNFSFSGVDAFQVDFSSAALRYGANESYTFGSPSSLQFCLYDKSKEADKRDKLHFWISQWSRTPSVADPFISEFKQGDDVKRLEARFHHSVIKQFCRGTKGMEVTTFGQLVPHLTGLWRYFLNNFRLHYNKNFIHPVWQVLMDDVTILAPHNPLIYQRCYKGETGSSRRNVAFWLGNALRLFVRQNYTVDFICKYFLESGLHSDLKAYFSLPPNADTGDLYHALREFLDRRYKELFLAGVAV